MSDPKRLELPPVSSYEAYENWRYVLKASVCSNILVKDPLAAQNFIEQIDDASVVLKDLKSDNQAEFAKLDM